MYQPLYCCTWYQHKNVTFLAVRRLLSRQYAIFSYYRKLYMSGDCNNNNGCVLREILPLIEYLFNLI